MIPSMLESIRSNFHRVFFLDLRMLACFRIGLGSIIIWDLLHRSLSFDAHYGISGVLPPNEAAWYADFEALVPLHLWFTTNTQQTVLFFIHGLAGLALILGIKVRWMTFICWLFVNSLHIRNPVILYGADRELTALLFWAMFLPLGARWSLDMKQRCRWHGKDRVEGWACAGLILQVVLIYFTSAWSKTGDAWSNGSAVFLALNVDAYTSDMGRSLLKFPTLLKGLTYGTLAVEWLAPLLLLGGNRRTVRSLGCWMLVCLQTGFLFFMRLGLFPLVSILGLIALFPPRNVANAECNPHQRHSSHWLLEILAVFFVCLMLVWQAGLVRHGFRSNATMTVFPDPIKWILKTTRLAQSWSMFSPDPPATDGWFILEYHHLQTGTSVDLLKGGESLDWEKFSHSGIVPMSDRWKEWFHKVYIRGIKWDRTLQYFSHEHMKKYRLLEKEHSFQLRLWRMEESAEHPGQAPKRDLLFEKNDLDAASTH